MSLSSEWHKDLFKHSDVSFLSSQHLDFSSTFTVQWIPPGLRLAWYITKSISELQCENAKNQLKRAPSGQLFIIIILIKQCTDFDRHSNIHEYITDSHTSHVDHPGSICDLFWQNESYVALWERMLVPLKAKMTLIWLIFNFYISFYSHVITFES